MKIYRTMDEKWKAVCRSRRKTVIAVLLLVPPVVLLVNPAVWAYPVFATWMAIALLVPLPFEIWALVRARSRKDEATT